MLYLVPTPIGNMEDLSARALRVLCQVKAVYCEDTRRTRKLFANFGIKTSLNRYNENHEANLDRIVSRLVGGEDIALTSDAGSPVISDPGLRLVQHALAHGIKVCAIPGACAVSTAVAGSGLPGDSFVFLGFLPRSPGRRTRALDEAAALARTVVVYESPHRVIALLKTIEDTLGPATQTVVCRELSKIHEEWIRGTATHVREALEARKELLGEYVVLFHPGKRQRSGK